MRVEPKLESCLRSWARECKASEKEQVFEVAVESVERSVEILLLHLNAFSRFWIVYRSESHGGVYVICSEGLELVVDGAFRLFEIVSLVDPSTGDGLTVDVSDEGGVFPVLQMAAWGGCADLIRSISSEFPEVHWMAGPSDRA